MQIGQTLVGISLTLRFCLSLWFYLWGVLYTGLALFANLFFRAAPTPLGTTHLLPLFLHLNTCRREIDLSARPARFLFAERQEMDARLRVVSRSRYSCRFGVEVPCCAGRDCGHCRRIRGDKDDGYSRNEECSGARRLLRNVGCRVARTHRSGAA